MFDRYPLVVDPPPDRDAVFEAAAVGAEHWHLPDPELVRIGQNGVFVAGSVIVRVGVTTAPIGKAITFAERLRADGIRVAAPARRDWVEHAGLSVSAWERIEFDPAARVDWEFVGHTVARVNAIDPVSVDHPLPFCAQFPWWDFATMLREADAADDSAQSGMHRAYDEHRWWIDKTRPEPVVLCHGDVHPGNVLVDGAGPVLIDWDLLCVGPREWDHAPLLRWTDRWGGESGTYEAFLTGYGQHIDDELADAIAETRLLVATLMRLRRARVDPNARDEAFRRLAYWRGEPDAPMWRAQ
jgi:Phosphotransferase enzyme family